MTRYDRNRVPFRFALLLSFLLIFALASALAIYVSDSSKNPLIVEAKKMDGPRNFSQERIGVHKEVRFYAEGVEYDVRIIAARACLQKERGSLLEHLKEVEGSISGGGDAALFEAKLASYDFSAQKLLAEGIHIEGSQFTADAGQGAFIYGKWPVQLKENVHIAYGEIRGESEQMTIWPGRIVFEKPFVLSDAARTLQGKEGELQKDSLVCKEACGSIKEFDFKSRHLRLDKARVYLEGQAQIEGLSVSIYNDGVIEAATDGDFIRIEGNMQLNLRRGGSVHTLSYLGTALFQNGIAELNGDPIVFEDSFGKVKAKRARLYFEGRVLQKLVLEENVELVNTFMRFSEVPKITHIAFADQVVVYPETQEAELTGDKVVLIDKLNEIEMVADAINVRRDVRTGKERIEGVGHVRFCLTDEELMRMKMRWRQ